jgi:Flp pilus assembly protein TadB
MANMRETISMGISLAVAVLAAVMGAFVWIALPLLVLAVLLFAWLWNPSARRHLLGACRTAITSSKHSLN